MRRARLIPPLLCLTAVVPSSLRAQWRLTGDAGLSHLRQAGLPESYASMLGATLDVAGERAVFRSSALGARTGDGRATGQWTALGAASTATWRGFAVQGMGSVSAFGQSNLRPTSSADAAASLRFGEITGVALGGGMGTTSHNGVSIPDARVTADAWSSYGSNRFGASLSSTQTRAVFGESSILVDASRVTQRYVDVSGTWRHEGDGWSAGAAGGWRGTGTSLANARGWQGLDAAVWVSPRVAVTAAAGRSLEDLVRGVPAADYATLALRISARPRVPLLGRRGRESGPRLRVLDRADGGRGVEVVAPGASRLEIMADFTGWAPVSLERIGDRWRFGGAVPSGPHRIAVRVDGGAWLAPANLPAVEDDLGGRVGLLTVP